MRKTLYTLSALLAVSVALSSGSAARADDKSDINALYTKIEAAMKAKNVKGIMALGTPDFVTIDHGQKMDAKQSAAMMEQQFKMIKSFDSLKMKLSKIDIKGKNAVATTTYSFNGDITGPDGKQHKMADKGVTKDILVKTPKGWLFKSSETISQHPTMDGKPVPTPGAPQPAAKKPKK